MDPRTKKLIGAPVLLIGLLFYLGAALYLADAAIPDHWLARLLFYPVAGVAWAFPAKHLVLWMNRPAASPESAPGSAPGA
ncbi:MAG: DUF2842 domain-containing protein [Pseudomonadota bacterium]